MVSWSGALFLAPEPKLSSAKPVYLLLLQESAISLLCDKLTDFECGRVEIDAPF
jgi:hypothetical protein